VERLCKVVDWLFDPVNLTAISTLAISAFTIILAAVGYVQARLIRKSIALAREEFISTHRPKIIIHAIDAKRLANSTNPGASELDGLGAVLLCINKGRSAALNIEIRGATLASQTIPDAKIQRPIIKTVESLESGIKIWTEIDTERSFQEVVAFKQPVYFVGTIVYFDKNKNRRETGFCYAFNLNSAGWRKMESEAHNYAY
jgi:hypothetical protein